MGENFFLLLQYQKTSKKKYVSIYLLFHICLHGFGGFLNCSSSLLCLLISCNSFPLRQKLEAYSLDKLPLLDIEPRSLTIRRKLLFSIAWVAGIRKKRRFLCFSRVRNCTSCDQEHTSCSMIFTCWLVVPQCQ